MSIIDNKTREKLVAIIRVNRVFHCSCGYPGCAKHEYIWRELDKYNYQIADAILRSPELRVETKQPRYFSRDEFVVDRELDNLILAKFEPVVGHGLKAERASEYADYLNSKESK